MAIDFEANDRSGKDVIKLEDVSKNFGSRKLFENVNMLVQYKDRTAIVGENGTGKSTLLKMILGDCDSDKGTVKVGSNVKIGYLSQHVFHTIGEERVIDVFRSEVIVNEGKARHILARFLFYGPAVFRKVNQLSGGERMRLRLAQLMYQDINLLVLDEPTNHLDIDSCDVLEEALEQFNGTILAVSHDRYFLNKLFNKVYWLKDETVYFFDGNYDWAKGKLNTVKVSQPATPEKIAPIKNAKPLKAAAVPNKAIEIEQKLEELEELIHTLKQKMESGIDLEMLQKQYTELEQLEIEREHLYKQLDDVV